MKITATNIFVDAGMIMVADINYSKAVKEFGFDKKELKKLGKQFDVPNGKYKVKWYIPESWNNELEGIEELTVTGSSIFIIDPCYVIGKNQDKWIEWLEKTGYGENINDEKAFVISSMGGDGEYEITLELIEAK